MTDLDNQIKSELSHLNPTKLEIIDESHLHIGHVGHGGKKHYRINITSDVFIGKSRITRQRIIHNSLKNLIDTHIHALVICAKTSEE